MSQRSSCNKRNKKNKKNKNRNINNSIASGTMATSAANQQNKTSQSHQSNKMPPRPEKAEKAAKAEADDIPGYLKNSRLYKRWKRLNGSNSNSPTNNMDEWIASIQISADNLQPENAENEQKKVK